MMKPILVTVSVLAALVASTQAVQTQPANPQVRAAVVTFDQVTKVAGHLLVGRYVVVHDDGKMARGEPCTTFYALDDTTEAKHAVSFHCVPRQRQAVDQITARTYRSPREGNLIVLEEYQFPGDTEAHAVPLSLR